MCCSSCSFWLFGFGTDSKIYIVRCNIQDSEICLKKDILYECSTQIHKVKKHDRRTNHRLPNPVGILHMLPSLVCNISKTHRTHNNRRRKNALENPQKKLKLHQPQMAAATTQERQNPRLQLRMRLQVHAKTTSNIQYA